MSFLSRLGASVGMGSCRISVAAIETQHFRGSVLHGMVLLEGGESEQHVKMLTVDLTEFWITQSGKNRVRHQRNHGRVTAAEDLAVVPGFRREFDFEMGIPSDARCTRGREGWTLNAEAHIAWAVDARAYSVLKVLPHPEILAIQRAARDAFGLIPLDWNGSAAVIYYNFGAPPGMQDQLDGVAFRLEVLGDIVNGEMILNKQEHGIGGLLGSMVGADRQGIPFSIPRVELRTKRESPNPAGAVPHIRTLLERSGITVTQ